MKNPGLYIHIPFCLKKCNYCAFYSLTDLELRDAFVAAVVTEMALYRGFGEFDTVYFGGGTPSLLNPHQLEKIVKGIHLNYSLSENTEWTLEANPGDLNEPYCRDLHGLGFNRINIGVQSLNDRILSTLGRRHTRQEAVAAIECARAARFENMGLDFMYGIPGQAVDACLADLESLIQFAPEHLSCYQLTIEKGTPLAGKFNRGDYIKLNEEDEIAFFLRLSERLSEAGYEHYEVSNYAKGPVCRSRHNGKYWDHTPYLGLGPAAHSFDKSRRWWNCKSIRDYCRDLESEKPPVEGEEVLTRDELRLEALSLGLRTSDGISLQEFEHRYGVHPGSRILENLVQAGLIRSEGDRIRPTRQGLAVADALAVELDRI